MRSGISAIIAAYERTEQTLATLRVVQSCVPPPDEILVHVDANQIECENAVRTAFPQVRILHSDDRLGPGGARNRLVDAARYEFIASFDDDSYPIDSDFFERALKVFEKFPEASIICAALYHAGRDRVVYRGHCERPPGAWQSNRSAVHVLKNGEIASPAARDDT